MNMAISNKPYLVRAIYQWCLDCDYTPHVLAGTGYDGVDVPQEYITDGQIVFNVARAKICTCGFAVELVPCNA